MKCSACQFENPEGMLFCGGCGNKLESFCPKCDFPNPPQFKFCGKCGHNLALSSEPPPKELSFDEKIAKIQRYLPKGITQKVLSQRDKIEGERKQVTVMFCDMEGFTALSERVGPEEAYAIMDQVYELLIHKVHDYEGTVNEMTGDGIMALFGAPIALEDAPQRAIRSAYAIHREMSRFSDKIRQERQDTPPLKMRIGVHTGPVVVGTLGNDLRVEFKAVGDTVNLASRVEGLAEPGSTYVTEDTFKLSEGLFRFEAVGEKVVKGKEEPVKVYRVIAPSTRRTRFDVSAETGLTPFVGRERELELLLDGFERSKAGRGQAVSLMAEAGVGKSRLLYESRKALANEDVTFLEGKCLSYSRGVAYHPVIDVLKSNFDIREEDGDLDIREKVIRGLKILEADEASTLPYLLELLSVKDSGIDKIPMSPEARKDRIVEAVKRITLEGSAIRPLIMAIEDLHWIDKSSEDYLKNLLDSISGARVLLIFTYRPEFVHTWGGKSYHSQLNLNRLSNRESLIMLAYLLGTENIDRDLEELILEKTEGVPFFIEEFVKSLKDLNIICREDIGYYLAKDIRDVTVPSTIQDVIMARVDSLPEGAKELLQTGSVIEREFSYELIKHVTGIPEEELLADLSILKDSELLYERGIYPQSTYVFKHALTREVVYDSILTKRKKRIHEKIGNAIEELYTNNLEKHYGLMAEHYLISENYEKGAEYCRLAAKRAGKTASFPNAISYAEKRVSCLERLPRNEDVEKEIVDARTSLGLYYINMIYHDKAKAAVEPVVELALEQGYERRVAQIYTIIGSYCYLIEEDYSKAFRYLEDALKIAERLNDTLSLWMANFWLGLVLIINCEFEKALYHMGKSLEINVAVNSLWGVSVVKSVIASWVYGFQGKIDQSYRTSEEGLRIAEESGDIFSKAYAYFSHGCACYYKGFLDKAEENLSKAIAFCERINYFSLDSMARRYLGDTYFDMGMYRKSEALYNEALSLSQHGGFMPSFTSLYKIALARVQVMNKEKAIDLQSLYKYANENKVRFDDGLMAIYIADIILNIDEKYLSEAEEWIMKAIDADLRNETMWNLGRDYVLCAELFKRKGDQSKAEENLKKAIETFKICGADGWVKKTEHELSEIS